MHQEEGFKFCLDTRSKKPLPWLIYSNTLVASNVQLSWYMKFAMEFFIPYSLASYFIQFSRRNDIVVPKHQVPLGMRISKA
jgi:hypothetical protein